MQRASFHKRFPLKSRFLKGFLLVNFTISFLEELLDKPFLDFYIRTDSFVSSFIFIFDLFLSAGIYQKGDGFYLLIISCFATVSAH